MTSREIQVHIMTTLDIYQLDLQGPQTFLSILNSERHESNYHDNQIILIDVEWSGSKWTNDRENPIERVSDFAQS